MQPKKSSKGKYLMAAVGIGALAAIFSGSAKAAAKPSLPLPGTSPKPATSRKTTSAKTLSPSPTTSTKTSTIISRTSAGTPIVAMHGFTDVLIAAEVWKDAVGRFGTDGGGLLLTVPDKTYVGTMISSQGNMLKFELKLGDGRVLRYWLSKGDVELMNANQRYNHFKTGGGKNMSQDALKALLKYSYGY